MTGQKPYIRLQTADQIFKQPNDIIPNGVNYTLIRNNETPNNFPIQGDIVVWEKAKWNGFGGHTAIVENADSNRGLVFQQNGLLPREGCRMVEWNFYNYTPTGWIRLNQPTQPPPPKPESPFTEIEPERGEGAYKIAKKAGYPVSSTGDQPQDKIIYARLREINNGDAHVLYGRAVTVDRDPMSWWNSIQPKPIDNIILPETVEILPIIQEVDIPLTDFMPTISIEETKQQQEGIINLEQILKIQELEKQIQELRQLKVANDLAADVENIITKANPDKLSFKAWLLGAVKGKNWYVNGFAASLLTGLTTYLTTNQTRLTNNNTLTVGLMISGLSLLANTIKNLKE